MRADVALAALTRKIRFVVVDVETTPSDTGVRVISIGAVPWTLADGVRGGAYWELDPGVAIENVSIHGINNAAVAGFDQFPAIIEALTAKLDVPGLLMRTVFVAHFAASDLRALKLEYQRAGKTMPDLAVLDTWALARALGVPSGGFGLRALLAHYGRKPTRHHHAQADAEDTAYLLNNLLGVAAGKGYDNIDALLADVHPELRTIADYEAGDPKRSESNRRGNGFTYIDRPDAHYKSHKKLPASPSPAELTQWLTAVRECIELRCPLLRERCEQLTGGQADMVTALSGDLANHLSAGRTADANTTLLAMMSLYLRHFRGIGSRRKVNESGAIEEFDRLTVMLAGHTRCELTPGNRSDACPGCRGSIGCAADMWIHAIAREALYKHFNSNGIRHWVGPSGRLAETAKLRPALAMAEGDLIISLLETNEFGSSLPMAKTVALLGLTTPTTALVAARALALDSNLTEAIAVTNTALAKRGGDTQPAWGDLADYRSSLTARAEQERRKPEDKPHRHGRSAPQRPSNRRFTNV